MIRNSYCCDKRRLCGHSYMLLRCLGDFCERLKPLFVNSILHSLLFASRYQQLWHLLEGYAPSNSSCAYQTAVLMRIEKEHCCGMRCRRGSSTSVRCRSPKIDSKPTMRRYDRVLDAPLRINIKDS